MPTTGAGETATTRRSAFYGCPEGTVALRRDGTTLTVPGEIGDLGALDAQNPEFQDRTGAPLGPIEVQGIVDLPQTCSLFAISNLSSVRGGAYLAVWYLTGCTAAATLEVQSVNPSTLGRLLKRLGMAWVPGTNNMAGSTREVFEAARGKCRAHHWHLLDLPAITG